MSERKVLNKYYPPDYDPSKIPKLKRAKDRQYVIRVMAPFNMRCKTCGNYIYKGTKFNARMETVQDDNYLGLRIYRFYIKCTRCVAEITFKTDPANQDYAIEHGATRNFEAEKLIEQEEKRLQAKREEDESNPMKMLEIRTRDSKREMEMMESLEELRELNQRHAGINYEGMLQKRQETEEERVAREKEEEDEEIRKIFNQGVVRRLVDDSSDEDTPEQESESRKRSYPATEMLTNGSQPSTSGATRADQPAAKQAKVTAAKLGIVLKKKKIEPPPTTASSSSQKSLNEKEPQAEAADVEKKSTTDSSSDSLPKAGSLNLLAGYGSASDSTDSD